MKFIWEVFYKLVIFTWNDSNSRFTSVLSDRPTSAGITEQGIIDIDNLTGFENFNKICEYQSLQKGRDWSYIAGISDSIRNVCETY